MVFKMTIFNRKYDLRTLIAAPRLLNEGTEMRLNLSYRYSLEELPLSKAKGIRYNSPSNTSTSCLCLPTGPLLCIRPFRDRKQRFRKQ